MAEIDLTAPEVQAAIQAAAEKATEGLKGKNAELLTELKGFKEKVKAFDGLDAEQARKDREAVANAEKERAEKAGDWTKRELQIVEKHTTELAAKDARAAKLAKALERELVDQKLTLACARHDAIPDLLLPHLRPHVRVKETDEGYEAFVANPDGSPRVADGKGSPVTFEALVEGFKTHEVFSHAFKPSGSNGSGAAGSDSRGGRASGTVDRNSPVDFGLNLEAIAKGEKTLV